MARPAIAEYRIVSYDGQKVHYWYEDHQTKQRVDEVVPAFRFLYDLLQHIPLKHFRMVGRFGLYSRGKNKEAQKIVNINNFIRTKQIEMVLEQKKVRKNYRQRMIESFSRDPIQCPCCKQTMELVAIWHADYGRIYYYNGENERKQEKKWGIREYERKKQKPRQREKAAS